MELFFDTETSGFINKKLPIDHPKQAWIMQIAFILSDEDRIYTEYSSLIKAEERTCHPKAEEVHKISIDECNKGGVSEINMLENIISRFFRADTIIAHNYSFDIMMLDQCFRRHGLDGRRIRQIPSFCTMVNSTNLCEIPGRYGKYKWPKLAELYKFLFDEELIGAHDALVDIRATRRCYYQMKKLI